MNDSAKSRVKEAAGDLTGKEPLKNDGKADQIAADAAWLVDGVAAELAG